MLIGSTRGTGACRLGVGTNADLYFCSFTQNGFVSIGETATSKVMIGTASPVAGFPFVVAPASNFLK